MKRAITGFHLDDDGDWVAELDCGHDQHVRHRPPFTLRPWAITAEGRASKLGHHLECLRCERFELPESARVYRATPEFDRVSVPRGLLARHATATGVWGRIQVLQGTLEYHIEDASGPPQLLTPERPGIVVPELEHRISPRDQVRFKVEFLRVARKGAGRC